MSNSVLKTALNQGPAFGRRPLAIGTGLMLAGAFSLALFFPTATFAQSDNPLLDTATLPTLEQLAQTNPDSLSYQMAYIDAFRKNTPGANWENFDSVVNLLVPQYTQWMQAHPKSAVLPQALGQAFANAESPAAKPYLLKAAAIDPKNAEVWSTLSIDAERWGDTKGSMEYMRKAAESAPEDPTYAFYYAMDFEQADPAMWRQKLYALAQKFPENERGAQGLYWLANRSQDPDEKLRTYEKLRTLYPPDKYSWSESGMTELFECYLKNDPEKAKQLAVSLLNKDGWPKLDSLAASFLEAKKMMQQGKYETAMRIINNARLPRYPDMSTLKATAYARAAAKAGHPDSSYSRLTQLYAAAPTSQLMTEIEGYARQLGFNKSKVQKDIHTLRIRTAKAAPDFNLGLYTTEGKAKLEDFKGKVVLLTFWFPGCGPCRGEFPHFQHVINQFKDKQVAYVGINVAPSQDPYVLPFMKGTGYTFIPLRGNSTWAWDHYQVRGEPTNFLIDPEGNIIFSNFRIDGNNEETLELMISELLANS